MNVLKALSVRHIGFDDTGVLGAQDHGAARFALHLLWPFAHPVLLEGNVRPNLAGTGKAEALLGARFCLQLGHFTFLSLSKLCSEQPGMPCHTARERGL